MATHPCFYAISAPLCTSESGQEPLAARRLQWRRETIEAATFLVVTNPPPLDAGAEHVERIVRAAHAGTEAEWRPRADAAIARLAQHSADLADAARRFFIDEFAPSVELAVEIVVLGQRRVSLAA